MLIRKKITAFIFSLVSVIFLLPNMALAQDDTFGRNSLSGLAIASTRSLFDMVVGIVNTILYFLGGIAILLFMYAGWLWFTSQGNSEKIAKAKKIMMSVIIGLAIIFSSYAAVNWIFKEAIRIILDPDSGTGGGRYGGGVGLGGGVIESHYPEPNATSIPRNTNIYITFKEPMMIDTIADAGSADCTGTNPRICPINTDNIRLHKAGETTVNVEDMTVTYDPDDPKVFEFNPYGTHPPVEPFLLGEQTKDTKYQMSLFNLMTGDNRRAFSFGSYSWYFTVGTYSDNTAPRVVSVRPRAGATSPRNTIVQINFSEAVNPTLASGLVDGEAPEFDNITLIYQNAAGVDTRDRGKYVISNQYRTVEFIPNERCGENSCGFDVFCLAGGENFLGTVTTNIKDMAGNVLDCSSGNCSWPFNTTNNIDLVPPKMTNMSPTSAALAALPDPVRMTFDKPLFSNSIKSANIKLFENVDTPINYWLRLSDADGFENNVINIRHERFAVSTNYLATSTSGIMDENQNCWYPCLCEGDSCRCDTPGAVCDTDSCQTPAP